MPMRVQSIRFGDLQWDAIARMAENEGVSAAQFIRHAAFGRAIVHALLRGNDIMALWLALVDCFSEHPEILARLEALRGPLGIELSDEPPSQP
jgi:hypothetical protein